MLGHSEERSCYVPELNAVDRRVSRTTLRVYYY